MRYIYAESIENTPIECFKFIVRNDEKMGTQMRHAIFLILIPSLFSLITWIYNVLTISLPSNEGEFFL